MLALISSSAAAGGHRVVLFGRGAGQPVGVVGQAGGAVGQLLAAAPHIRKSLLDIAQQVIKGAAHRAQLVLAVQLRATGEVVLLVHPAHGLHQRAHRQGERAFDQHHQRRQQQRQADDLADKHHGIAAELGVEVVQV
ncbi:MAG: hypothetical protein U1E47_06775 [Rivihabitans pingtungensis]